jgi:hypothetical protein
MHILQTIVPEGHNSEGVDDWIMAKATEICGREVSWLTDNARKGPFHEKAKSLRIPANSMKVQLIKTFWNCMSTQPLIYRNFSRM